MSDNEDWRRKLAERLHPNTDWTVRPMSQRAASPVAPMISIQEPQIAPLQGGASTNSDAATVDRAALPVRPQPAPIVANAPEVSDTRIWPYVAAALALLTAAAGWLFVNRVEESPAPPATVKIAAAPAPSPAPVRLASLPADDAARCNATLAAPALSALVRQGTAFDGQEAHAATPAMLGAVRQLTADGSTAVCRGVLELELVDVHAGSPVALQIVSGPVEYAVDGGAGANVPTFRILQARSIVHRLANMQAAVPVTVAAAEPVANVPPPIAVKRAKATWVAPTATPETALHFPVRPAAAEPLPTRRVHAETAALPATAETPPPRRAEVDAAAPPATDAEATPEITSQPDERAADSAAAQAIYGAIAQSGDPQAVEAADEGRDLYLRQSRRCATPACTAIAYKRWLTRLRDIDVRSRGYAN